MSNNRKTKSIRYSIRQVIKLICQCVVFPCVYYLSKLTHSINSKLIIFADSHQNFVPCSQESVLKELSTQDYMIRTHFYDYSGIGALSCFFKAIQFMWIYAQASCVIISDYFLPVASCNKRKGTNVIQLWHGVGVLKKFAYDSSYDIPSFYKVNVFKNYDLMTVSSSACVPYFQQAMKLTNGVCQPLGVCKSDKYFSREWKNNCKKKFYLMYPEAKGKKIILWAPTFRGNYINPITPLDDISPCFDDSWFFICKAHPHCEKKEKDARIASNCSIATEELLPIIDLLVTDYSSLVFDGILMKKPYVLYVPDLKMYEMTRGVYLDIRKTFRYVADNLDCIGNTISCVFKDLHDGVYWDNVEKTTRQYIENCDGKATKRVLQFINNSATQSAQ